MTRLIAAALAGAFLFLAGPAMAGSTECLYQALPVEKRDEVDRIYQRSLNAGLASSVYNRDDLFAALVACKVPTEGPKLEPALKALAGREFETQAGAWILERPGMMVEQLETAWKGLDPELAKDIREALNADLEDQLERSLLAAREPFLKLLGLPVDRQSLDYAKAYLTGRFAREVFEPKF